MRELAMIGLAGAAGTIGRWALSGWVYRWLGERFPWGTLVVNVIGCLLLGALMKASLTTDAVSPAWRVPLTVGFLGAFTTFSTFGYETVRYVEDGAWLLAAANIAANVTVGLAATLAGFALARALMGAS